eukprot:CAMPEP_0175146456 /NCGR_PEP_ID=MMETSP0087-20121206/15391_1 /TAXON_ID=136419 /ORGANISM="Unknown Unknown, Strain D1" /LENGTH=449 /DNA_ID=CAMNT_0016431425 /DNA_START=59 /DNA_END=1408 /DNA_ORIENTATION=-
MTAPVTKVFGVLIALATGWVVYLLGMSAGRSQAVHRDMPVEQQRNVAAAVVPPEPPTPTGYTLSGASHHEKDMHKYTWPDHTDPIAHPGLAWIYRHQHPEARNPPSSCKGKKFLTYIWPKKGDIRDTRNIGALVTTLAIWLQYAMEQDRILVYDDVDWNIGDCNAGNHTCYFLPVSSCTYQDVLDQYPADSHYQITDLNTPAKILAQKHGHHGVWKATTSWYRAALEEIRQNAFGAVGYTHQCKWLQAAMLYFLRVQPWVQKVIGENIKKSLPDWFDPAKTVSMPIRGSDHCKGHNLEGSSAGEYDCKYYMPEYFMKLAAKVKKFDPNVDTILMTSEDQTRVEEIKKLVQGTSWKLVLNKGDVMQGTGSSTGLTLNRKDIKLTVSQVMASAISTIHFQLRSRYLLGTFRSAYGIMMIILHQTEEVTFTDARMWWPTDPNHEFKEIWMCP